MKKYFFPLVLLAVFEAVAVVLWLTRDNLFYLFNFSYIGVSVSLGVFLFVKKYRHARRIVQLLVGLYMLVYLGLICGENMQIEGFWYYLFTGGLKRDDSLCRCKDLRAAAVWPGLVRLCLLDGDGAGLFAVQSAGE